MTQIIRTINLDIVIFNDVIDVGIFLDRSFAHCRRSNLRGALARVEGAWSLEFQCEGNVGVTGIAPPMHWLSGLVAWENASILLRGRDIGLTMSPWFFPQLRASASASFRCSQKARISCHSCLWDLVFATGFRRSCVIRPLCSAC